MERAIFDPISYRPKKILFKLILTNMVRYNPNPSTLRPVFANFLVCTAPLHFLFLHICQDVCLYFTLTLNDNLSVDNSGTRSKIIEDFEEFFCNKKVLLEKIANISGYVNPFAHLRKLC